MNTRRRLLLRSHAFLELVGLAPSRGPAACGRKRPVTSRVARALAELPALRRAVLAGEVSWTVARRVVAELSPESEGTAVAWLRGRTVRAVEAILAAHAAGGGVEEAQAEAEGEEQERVRVALPATLRLETKWAAACELARRMAGEELPRWECAEAIAAECASAVGCVALEDGDPAAASKAGRPARRRMQAGDPEPVLREAAFPHLRWKSAGVRPDPQLEALLQGLEEAGPKELDRRLRAALAFLQAVDFEMGRILRQVVDRGLVSELGFESFERYVEERLDLSTRTARRLVRLARAEHRAPAVASAFREGRITQLQAEALLRGNGGGVAFAERVTLRRLREGEPARVDFTAPRSVARFFLAMVVRMGGLEAMLDHAVATWTQAGGQFEDYADFERDGFRCTVPGCSARRNLQSHHVHFRSAGGPDEAWNRTTLCAFHHQRGVHQGRLRIRGRALEALVFELGFGSFRSGDVRIS